MAEKIATRDAYGKALIDLGKENKDIVVLDADLSSSTRTAKFQEEFPKRFFNMGIAEQNLMGTAAGFAAAGKISFASSFAVFATGRAFEIIRNSICYPKLNVKIAATHAGLTVGEDGATHQAIEDLSLMRSLPNMTVICPADGVETEAAIKVAAKHQGPVYIRLGRSGVPILFDENYQFKIGKAVELKDGKDVTIIATGIMVDKALKAQKNLEQEGISVRVLNMPTIKPIDKEAIIEAAKETRAIVTAEEHSIIGGLGSAVAEVIVENELVPMERVGIKDTFGESGKSEELLKKYGLTAEDIVEKVRTVMKRK